MNTTDTEWHRTTGSGPACSWMGCKGTKFTNVCGKPACYKGPSFKPEGWLLCEGHFHQLINAYNKQTRKIEEPKWKRLA